jgi:monomeric sarcosine oxidase
MRRANETVLVVGGGVMGAAIADALARRGHPTTLVERHRPGHARGSSHGDGRIFRVSYDQADYVEFAVRARRGWTALEERTASSLFVGCGTWDAASLGVAAVGRIAAALDEAGLRYQRLTGRESRARWPQLGVGTPWDVLYQADGGAVRADRAVRAFWESARAAGGVTEPGRVVLAIEPVRDGVLAAFGDLHGAQTDRRRFDRVVLAAGAWNRDLLRALGHPLPLSVTRELVAYFAEESSGSSPTCDLTSHGPDSLPAFLFHPDRPEEFLVYGLPRLDVGGVKVGRHHAGQPIADPEQPVDDQPENLFAVRDFVRARLPFLRPEPILVQRCLYTTTPDQDFVLDRSPSDPRVVVAAGFSGHGFKFAPAIGESVADLVADDSAAPHARFRWDRPALRGNA